MKTLARFALLIATAAPALHAATAAAPTLQLEAHLFIFKDAEFRSTTVAGARTPSTGQVAVVPSPATISFDTSRLELQGASYSWSTGAPPAPLTGIDIAPTVFAVDQPAVIRSTLSAQYLEKRPDGSYALNETPPDSPDSPRYQLTFHVEPADAEAARSFHVVCQMEIATVKSRQAIAGVDLDVGKPVIATFNGQVGFTTRPADWNALLFRTPNGSDYSALFLVRFQSAGSASPSPRTIPTLYVQIGALDELAFAKQRHTNDGHDHIAETIHQKGDAIARVAGLNAHIVLLEENQLPPPNTAFLKINWDAPVAVEFFANATAKPVYLGRAFVPGHIYPNYTEVRQRFGQATLDERIYVAMDIRAESTLYGALYELRDYLLKQSPPSSTPIAP